MAIKDHTCIPVYVRDKVISRDSKDGYPCCVYCGKPAINEHGLGLECHHHIPRSLGGMGIEENLVMLCHQCHEKVQHGDKFINEFIQEYLFLSYEDWDEEKLVWRK